MFGITVLGPRLRRLSPGKAITLSLGWWGLLVPITPGQPLIQVPTTQIQCTNSAAAPTLLFAVVYCADCNDQLNNPILRQHWTGCKTMIQQSAMKYFAWKYTAVCDDFVHCTILMSTKEVSHKQAQVGPVPIYIVMFTCVYICYV